MVADLALPVRRITSPARLTAAPIRLGYGPSRPQLIAVLSALAIGSFALIHLLMAGSIDPLVQTMSMYGVHAQSAGAFAIGCTALAVACVLLAPSLARGGHDGHDGQGGQGGLSGRLAKWSAYGAAIMLELVVIFPTDLGEGPLTLHAEIHRYAAGVAFALLGVVVAVASGRCGERARTPLRVLTAVAIVAVTLTIAATFWPDFLAMAQWRGVPQRALLLDYAIAVPLIGYLIASPQASYAATGNATAGRANAPAAALVG